MRRCPPAPAAHRRLFGYASVAVGCAVYKFMFEFIGGIEFVTQADQSSDAYRGSVSR